MTGNPYDIVERWIQGIPGVGALASLPVVTPSSTLGQRQAISGARTRVDARTGQVSIPTPQGPLQDQLFAVVDLYGAFWASKPLLASQGAGVRTYDNGTLELMGTAAITAPPGVATWYFIFDATLNAWIPA